MGTPDGSIYYKGDTGICVIYLVGRVARTSVDFVVLGLSFFTVSSSEGIVGRFDNRIHDYRLAAVMQDRGARW